MESGDKDSGRKRKGQMKAKEKKEEEEEEEPMSISAVHFVDPVVRWAHLISSARPVVAPSDSSIGARFVNSPVRDRPDLCLSLCLALFFFFFFSKKKKMDGRVLIASYQVFPLQPARVNSIFSMQPSRPGRNQGKKKRPRWIHCSNRTEATLVIPTHNSS